METSVSIQVQQIKRERAVNGLLFGIIAGVWFGSGVWLLDALLLAQANAQWPWVKLATGLPFLILLGALAGWLTARLDSAFFGAVIWAFTGLAFVWIASHIPFQGSSFWVGIFEPSFAGLEVYPFVESAWMRMNLLYFIVGILIAIGGGFELFFVESATRASSFFLRLFTLSASIIVFLPIGLIVDNLINQSLREPVIALNNLLQVARQPESLSLSIEKQRDLGLRATLPITNLLNKPYKLILGAYDPVSFDESSVHINFGGDWAVCNVLVNKPTVCRLSTERYLRQLDCLARSGFSHACQIKQSPEAPGLSPDTFGFLDHQTLSYGILGQYGTAVIGLVEDAAGRQVQCYIRDQGDLFLESCSTRNGVEVLTQVLPPTPTRPTRTPTPSPQALPTEISPPQTIWIPPDEINLDFLEQAPQYDLSLEISEDLRTFQGRLRLLYTNTEDLELDRLFFRLLPNGAGSYGDGWLYVQQALVEGQMAETNLSVQNSALEVRLPDSILPGEKLVLELDFNGLVPVDFGGDATPSGYGIYNLSDGVLALSGWYPLLAVYDEQGWNLDAPSTLGDSVYSEIAFYTVEILLPQDLLVAATGLQVAREIQGSQTRLRFESGPARDFFVIASRDFVVTSQQVGGLSLNSYHLPGDENAGSQALRIAQDSFQTFDQSFGPYPYTELDIVAAPMRNALGVEFPGIVLINARLYQQPERPEFAITIAHEVAHQWWYSTVGNNVFDEPWLDEALTTYSSGLYFETALSLQAQAGLENNWQSRYEQLLSRGADDVVTASLPYFESLSDASIYSGIVYVKGALFFKALRQEIGDEAFFQALRSYYHSYYFGVARTADLLQIFENSAGRELDDFYQYWLYSKNIKEIP